MKFIPYSRHFIDNKDIESVKKVLRSYYLTTGNEVKRFENNFKKYVKSKYATSCSNGTSALMLAYLSLGVKKNTTIIMPSINFVASANMATMLNAKIYLTDVDQFTGQMTVNHLIECIKKNKLKKIDVLVLMHHAGNPTKVNDFSYLKKKYKFKIIEDACHALGASYNGVKSKVGSCKYSDIAVFSFHPLKSITTGEGGIVTTNNNKIFEKIRELKNHGIRRNEGTLKKYIWKYDVVQNGFNFRLTDFQCALGNSQLKNLDKFIKFRKKIAYLYKINLLDNNAKILNNNSKINNNSAFHLFVIHLNLKKINLNKDEIIQKLYKKKIITQVHYIPLFKFKSFKHLYRQKFFKGAIKYYKSALSIPIYYGMTKGQVDYIIKEIKRIL